MVACDAVEAVRVDSWTQACDPGLLSCVDAVVVCVSAEAGRSQALRHEMGLLADALASHRLSGVVLSSGISGVVPGEDNPFITISPNVSSDELWGRVATIRQYQPLLRRMEDQVAVMQRLGKKLNEHFVEVDQELRLASRLQRDFLPKRLPEVGDIRFATLYRPAAWVSGDVYDVRRLDEKSISIYLADAVGHGVAAGLLTMFIKQAIAGKHIGNDGYRIVPPAEVLEGLNSELAGQQLPNCQFVTACYATIDAVTHELTFSRAGHPHPIHVGVDGTCCEVRTVGGLLGVFPGESFPSVDLVLQPGERLILYSDGLEEVIITHRQRSDGQVRFSEPFLAAARQPAGEFIDALTAHLDRAEGSLSPGDDMTVVAVERLKR